MKTVLLRIEDAAVYALDLARWAWKQYPARTISVIASVVVFAAARLGIVIPELSVIHAVEVVLPILLAGQATHNRVSPSK